MAAMLAGCGAAPRAIQVELLEDERAQMVELDSGRARVVPRASLPHSAREGDVVVDGRVDAARTAEARRAVRGARRALTPGPGR